MMTNRYTRPMLASHASEHPLAHTARWAASARQGLMVGLAAMVAFSSALLAQPSQSPLLVGSAGAKPNLMIALDNSGSMAFPYHETYNVTTDGTTAGTGGGWFAQRSAQVNSMYYNPRVTYRPRVGPDGNPLVPGDGIVFVSNQGSTGFQYQVFRNAANEIRTTHSIYAVNPDVAGWPRIYNITGPRIAQHTAFTAATVGANPPAFTYAICNAVTIVGGRETGCTAWTRTDIRPGNPVTVPLAAGANRTDCGATSCTSAQEITNILNWYRYYLFRAPAVATAIGQALANPDYDNRIRVGYSLINVRNDATIGPNNLVPGATTDRPLQLRGVRTYRLDGPHLDSLPLAERNEARTNAQQIYTWLYDQDGTQNRHSNLGASPAFDSTVNRRQAPYGGTPLHNMIDRVAQYYRVAPGVTENAWRTNPLAVASATNPEMSCRRSFNLLFSDGAWNAGTTTANAAQDSDNIIGPLFSRSLPSGATETFRYQPQGINTVQGRRQYTPYPGTARNGLSDLTARYFWHEDMRPALDNGVQTRAAQPTFWQNMASYTVGYLIRPRGETAGATAGLTFNQITNYQAQYAEGGFASATQPTWATGDVNAAAAGDPTRIDDFIQAGFTGGGRGFSVASADEVRRAFQLILSDIVNSSGRDAGVAVSSTGGAVSSIAGNLKYNVTYRTLDNSGNVSAQELDADGQIVREVWNAQNTIPEPGVRRVFSISGRNTPVNFNGNFSGLPNDIRTALATGPDAARIPTNSNFVNYLRGADPVRDAFDRLFRQRTEKMGAMVNPPSIYMGGDRDFRYDMATVPMGDRVSGSDQYLGFVRQKVTLPASLFVATNAGQVHAFDAQSGTEQAVYMPRRSLRQMLNNARDDYSFRYVLDGPISEHDIFFSSSNHWNHLAVGSGGRGERLIYALRAPLNPSAVPPNRTPGQPDFLWETGPDEIDSASFALGHTTHAARSGQTVNGDWVLLINSGHHNGFTDGSRHGLLVLNPLTGEVIRRINLPTGYSAGRGLSGVTVVRNQAKRVVAAYAGDANGNLWRFNLLGAPSEWAVSYGRPLFTTPGNRPIYGHPAWQFNTQHGQGTAVIVATGMLLDDADTAVPAQPEYIYGIYDPTPIGEPDATSFVTRTASDLLAQSFIATSGQVGPDGNTYFQTTRASYDMNIHRGWRMELLRQPGERNIDQVRNLGPNVLIATTVIAPPSNPNEEICRLSNLPANYLYVLDAVTGAMPRRGLDANRDGRLDAFSVAAITTGGYSRGMAIKRLSSSSDGRYNISSPGNTGRRECTDCENDGEGTPTESCRSVRAAILGTEEGSITAGASCEVGWNRSQYQLSRPPL